MPFITFAPGTVIKSADENTNWGNAVHKTDQQKVTSKVMSGVAVVDTDGGTITFDMSDAGGNIHSVVLGGNRTLAFSNVSVGQSFMVRLTQDATGGRTVTWPAGISWPGGVAPTLSSTASKTDVFGFTCTANGVYDGYIVGQYL